MPYITNRTIVKSIMKGKAEAIEARVIISLIHISQAHAIILVPVTNPKSARHMGNNVFTAISKASSLSFVIPSNVEKLLYPV